MNRRLIWSLLFAACATTAYACSDDPNGDPAPPDGTDGGTTSGDATVPPPNDGGDTDGGDTDGGTDSPIEGLGAPTLITHPENFQNFADGPVWGDGALHFSDYADPRVYRFTPPSAFATAHEPGAPLRPLGSAYDDKSKRFVTTTVDNAGNTASQLVRWGGDAGAPAPIVVTFEDDPWDSPNDLVIRPSDGTLYVTDPAYQTGNLVNRVFRVTPAGAATEVDRVTLGERPNGIALSPDEKTLYVSFTMIEDGPAPFIRKYTVATNGDVGTGTKFADLPADSLPDGMTTDSAGNVYVAMKTGVEVFKPNGDKWGTVTVPKQATNVAIGGADKRTLFVTAIGGVYQLPGLKVAGN